MLSSLVFLQSPPCIVLLESSASTIVLVNGVSDVGYVGWTWFSKGVPQLCKTTLESQARDCALPHSHRH
jgi:hypothetical protein